MSYKDKIIEYFAKEACKKISAKVVRKLQKMTKEMLSGDDSPLKNVWDEICVQVQDEEFLGWDAYLDTIRQLIQYELESLDKQIKQTIWLQTDEGSDWEYDNEENEQQEDTVPFYEDDIVEYILNAYILQSAVNWSNKRIEKFIESGYEYD